VATDPSDISARALPMLYEVFRMHFNKKNHLKIINFNLNESQSMEDLITKL